MFWFLLGVFDCLAKALEMIGDRMVRHCRAYACRLYCFLSELPEECEGQILKSRVDIYAWKYFQLLTVPPIAV